MWSRKVKRAIEGWGILQGENGQCKSVESDKKREIALFGGISLQEVVTFQLREWRKDR